MRTLRQHRHKAVLFVLLSGADLALTCLLLQRRDGSVYEANWLAGWVLTQFGYAGLAAFKAAVVCLAGALLWVVAAARPRAARRLTTFGCAAVGLVVLYSLALWGSLELRAAPPDEKDMATIQREGRQLDGLVRRRAEFRGLLERCMAALAAGECTLDEALARLSASRELDGALLAQYRAILGVTTDGEALAALVVRGAFARLKEDGSPAAQARAEHVLALYRSRYGAELPRVEELLVPTVPPDSLRTPENVPVAVAELLPARPLDRAVARRAPAKGALARRCGGQPRLAHVTRAHARKARTAWGPLQRWTVS